MAEDPCNRLQEVTLPSDLAIRKRPERDSEEDREWHRDLILWIKEEFKRWSELANKVEASGRAKTRQDAAYTAYHYLKLKGLGRKKRKRPDWMNRSV